jgi:hypothetical protein
MITPYDLDKIFFYDSEGDLFHRSSGKLATHNHGRYLRVAWNGTKYYAHHIIWYVTYGYWPHFVDHKNGNHKDNRLENLRDATMSQNIANADFGEMRGIELHGAKFRARVWVEGKRTELGSYSTLEEAKEAYRKGAEKYFGEFAYHNRDT